MGGSFLFPYMPLSFLGLAVNEFSQNGTAVTKVCTTFVPTKQEKQYA